MTKSNVVPVELSNGQVIQIEVSGGETEVADLVNGAKFSFASVVSILEGLVKDMTSLLCRAGPSKAEIEFGVEISLEAGRLTALLVKGEGKANLKITLGWEGLRAAETSSVAATDKAVA